MNQNVILISAAAQFIAFFTVLFGGRLPAAWTRGVLVLASLVSVVCAGLALGQVTDGASTIEWVGRRWFAFDEKSVFSISLRANPWECLVWLALSVLFLVYDYKSIAIPRAYRQGQAIARCVLAVGTLLCALSGNFITYFTGAALCAYALFLGIALGSESDGADSMTTAGAAFRYFGLVFCGLLLLLAAMLGLGSGAGSLSFDLLAAASSTAIIPSWAVVSLFSLGVLTVGMQLPALCLPRYLGAAGGLGPLLLIVGQVLMAPILPLKIYNYLSTEPLLNYFAILPALTCVFAAFYAVSERRPVILVGWLAAYASGSTFIAAFQGGYQSALLGSLASAVALMMMATALESDLVAERVRKPFLLVGSLAFMGMPLSAMGQARIEEYAALGMLAQGGAPTSWLVLSLKVIADLLVAVACWRIVRVEPWLRLGGRSGRQKTQESVWRGAVPLGLLSVCSFSIVMGGLPLGGLLGEVESSIDPRIAWFGRLVTAPGAPQTPSSDEMLMARIMLVCVLIVAALFSLLWAFRELKRGEEFLENWNRITHKIDLQRFMEFMIWDMAFRRGGGWLGRSLATADKVTFDAVDEHAVAMPFMTAANVFKAADDRVLDRGIVDGVGRVVVSLGGVVKILQGGTLHKYILFGLVVTALALVAAVLRTGA